MTVINKISTWALGDTKLLIDKIRCARGTTAEPEPWIEPRALAKSLGHNLGQRLRHWCRCSPSETLDLESRDSFGDESASGVKSVLEAAG